MAAYVIADVAIQDMEPMEAYRQRVLATVEQFGGRYLVAGADGETLEGTWHPRSMAVIEFPNVEQAHAWWSSDVYRDVKALRQQAGATNLVVVPGL